jgi:hypothetical protein
LVYIFYLMSAHVTWPSFKILEGYDMQIGMITARHVVTRIIHNQDR